MTVNYQALIDAASVQAGDFYMISARLNVDEKTRDYFRARGDEIMKAIMDHNDAAKQPDEWIRVPGQDWFDALQGKIVLYAWKRKTGGFPVYTTAPAVSP